MGLRKPRNPAQIAAIAIKQKLKNNLAPKNPMANQNAFKPNLALGGIRPPMAQGSPMVPAIANAARPSLPQLPGPQINRFGAIKKKLRGF